MGFLFHFEWKDRLTSRYRRRERRHSSLLDSLPASDLERSKDVSFVMEASKAALRLRSQAATGEAYS